MDKYDIIKRPITTEKSELLRRENNTYTFEVDKRANKIEVKNAIESIFDVKVESVNTLNIKPKNKRHRMTLYKTPQRKKALVKLQDGDSITYYEGV